MTPVLWTVMSMDHYALNLTRDASPLLPRTEWKACVYLIKSALLSSFPINSLPRVAPDTTKNEQKISARVSRATMDIIAGL